MKRTLKTLLIALLLVPCMFAFTACGGDDDIDTSSKKLATPGDIQIYTETMTATWNGVDNANIYKITLIDSAENVSTVDAMHNDTRGAAYSFTVASGKINYDLSALITHLSLGAGIAQGQATVKVQALDLDEEYEKSDICSKNFIVTAPKLDTPTVYFNTSENYVYCNPNSVASSYFFEVYQETTFLTRFYHGGGTYNDYVVYSLTNQNSLTNFLNAQTPGEYRIHIRQRGDGKNFTNSELSISYHVYEVV